MVPLIQKQREKIANTLSPMDYFFLKYSCGLHGWGGPFASKPAICCFFVSETGNEISVVRGMAPRVDDTIGETKDSQIVSKTRGTTYSWNATTVVTKN